MPITNIFFSSYPYNFLCLRIATKLADGNIPIDKIRVHLTDLVVQSLRNMPEHSYLATNWSAMLTAIRSENPQQDRMAGREEVAKQRVLLRFLACAAELEVAETNIDGKTTQKLRKPTTSIYEQPDQALSVSLLKSLPQLLIAFKGDVISLRSLTLLPRYLIPTIFSLPSRKAEFLSLVKNLCGIYVESTDEEVLLHISRCLAVLAKGSHARVPDVKVHLKKLSALLQERLMQLLDEDDPGCEKKKKSPKRKKSSPRRKSSRLSDASSANSDLFSDAASPAMDLELSIQLCLKRWRILTTQCAVEFLFDETDDKYENVEGFCNTVAEAMAKRLQDRKAVLEESDRDTIKAYAEPEIWRMEETRIHSVVAKSIDESLRILLSITAWKLRETLMKRSKRGSELDDEDMEQEADAEQLTVLSMRDRLVKLLGVCFDQYLESTEESIYSEEHVAFASDVQASAGKVASDVRTLFLKEWCDSADPVRRALALTNDSQLIGGFARYFQSREEEVRNQTCHVHVFYTCSLNLRIIISLFAQLHQLSGRAGAAVDNLLSNKADGIREATLVNDLLMPLIRALTANWNDCSRREAGIALAHIAGSGQIAAHTIHSMTRLIKKVSYSRQKKGFRSSVILNVRFR